MKRLDEDHQQLVEEWAQEQGVECENPGCNPSTLVSAGYAIGGIGPAKAVLRCTKIGCGERVDFTLSERQAEALGFDRSLRAPTQRCLENALRAVKRRQACYERPSRVLIGC